MSQKDPKSNLVRYNPSSNSTHSKFKVKELLDLNNPSRAYSSPLAVIAHIDANAFFAQVEQLRLGLSVEDAVVCVQWQSIIAVSYKAREYGISRMDTLESAKLKCPVLKPIHTAVFRKGENFWRYHDDDKEFPSPKDHKVSLDPYRRESRKIMNIFKNNVDLVEKASVDESFMDLGRLVLKKLFETIPTLHEDILKMDKNDTLPLVPRDLELEVFGEVIQGDFEKEGEFSINDWDDVLILLGSIITYDIRQQVQKELGYTTSCGIARVKTMAKLASGFMKPDNQTIVRTSAINNFLKNFDFTDFWSMGGKTGEFIKQKLSPPLEDSIKFIRENYDLHELEDYLVDKQLAEKLYKMIRGAYYAPLSERILFKSMNSNKNIRGVDSVTKLEHAMQWVRVFAADLYQRLVETDDENGFRTRPKTISIHYRSSKDWTNPHSKQSSLPLVPKEDMEETLYKYGVNILKMLESQYGKFYPLQNLNMTIGNFEIMDNNSSSIMNFAKKGNVEDLFAKQIEAKQKKAQDTSSAATEVHNLDGTSMVRTPSDQTKEEQVEPETPDAYTLLDNGKFKCLKCEQEVEYQNEHTDFHYALELTEALNGSESLSSDLQKISNRPKSYGEMRLNSRSPSTSGSKKRSSSSKKINGKAEKKSKLDKSQSRLPF